MRFSFIVAAIVIAVIAAVLHESLQRIIKERRLSDKRLLNDDDLLAIFRTEGLTDQEVLDCLRIISEETSVRRSLLRPDLRFDEDLAPVRWLEYDDLTRHVPHIVFEYFQVTLDSGRRIADIHDLLSSIAQTRKSS